jgi:cob(I)alamin adenosyltransferase
MRIYTRTGDDGTTALFGGKRVNKDDLRLEAYGTLDELNAFVGALGEHAACEPDLDWLRTLQNDLFNLGSHLATVDPAMLQHLPALPEGRIQAMEAWMDEKDANLPELKSFILPGGHPAVASAHICRTLSRRAERRVVALARTEEVPDCIPSYLNRLSDVFFVWGRSLAARTNSKEVLWSK